MSQEESWSPDEGSGTEVFDQGDEALDEQSRTDPEFVERLEQDPSLDPTLLVDEREIEEAARSSTTLSRWRPLREGSMTPTVPASGRCAHGFGPRTRTVGSLTSPSSSRTRPMTIWLSSPGRAGSEREPLVPRPPTSPGPWPFQAPWAM